MKAAWFHRLFGALVLIPMGLFGCASEGPSVIHQAPEIRAFAADPVLIPPGHETTLRWITSAAVSVRILDGEGTALDLGAAAPSNGSVVVKPSVTTAYRLVATGAGGDEVSETLEVQVMEDAAVSAKIWLEPESITIGELTTVHWASSHATHIAIKRDGNTYLSSSGELSGSRELETHDTTEFTIEATGPLGTAEASATLSVKPAIESFEVKTTRPLLPGDEAEVAWTTRGADTLILSNGDGFEQTVRSDAIARGSLNAPVGKEGTFTLTATRKGVEATAAAPVTLLGPPVISKFEAKPSAVTAGAGPRNVELSWTIRNAQSIEIIGSAGAVDVSGKRANADRIEVSNVTGGTSFTLRAINSQETTEATVDILTVPSATITGFRVVPSRIAANEPIFATWTTQDAAKVELRRGEGEEHTHVKLPVDSDMTEGVFETAVPSGTFLHLDAFNLAGDRVSESVQVRIGAPQVTASVNKVQVQPGEDLTFSWDNLGGNLLRIRMDGAVLFETDDVFVIDEGEVTLKAPAEEGYYEYEVHVSNGRGSNRSTHEVLVSGGPQILSFSVDPGPIPVGGEVSLSWTVENDHQGTPPTLELEDDLGNLYDLNGTDPNDGSISLVMTETGTRTFTLRAFTEGFVPAVAQGSTAVFGDPEVTFTANPPAYDPFNRIQARLQWESTFATTISLFRLAEEGGAIVDILINRESQPSVVRGHYRDVTPPEPGAWYRVEVENPWGETASQELYVEYLLPTIHSFTVSANSVPQNSNVTVSWNTGAGRTYINGPLQVKPMVEVQGAPAYVSNVGQQGTTQITMETCAASFGVTDEGCAGFTFPSGFEFPFDGKMYTEARAFANGFLGLDPSMPEPGNTWSGAAATTFPTTAKMFVQMAPFMGDHHLPAANTISSRLVNDGEGDALVIQWTTTDAENFQIALRESGVFEYRYGSVDGSTSFAVGYQNVLGSTGWTFSTGKPTASQLSNRTWRYDPEVAATGSFTILLKETTDFRLCVYGADWDKVCQTQTVTVTP